MKAAQAELLVDCHNTLGESCYWDTRDQSLWWTDIEASRVHSYGSNKRLTTSILPGRAGFILPRRRGGFVVGFPKQIALADAKLQNFSRVCDIEPDLPTTRVNDAAVDPYGGIVFGTFDETADMAHRRPIGSVYRLSPEGRVEKLFSGVTVSNGLAFSPDGDVMYFTDSHDGIIRRFRVGRNFSSFEEIENFAKANAAPGRPDGGATDAEGGYWSARVWGNCVVRFDRDGQVTDKIDLPAKGPTCVTLGGANLKQLFITTLRVRHSLVELELAPLSGGVFTKSVDVPGTETLYCSL